MHNVIQGDQNIVANILFCDQEGIEFIAKQRKTWIQTTYHWGRKFTAKADNLSRGLKQRAKILSQADCYIVKEA
jgi:hypothetical protein